MARESEAMAEHALGSGRSIPFEVIERLDQALSAFHSSNGGGNAYCRTANKK